MRHTILPAFTLLASACLAPPLGDPPAAESSTGDAPDDATTLPWPSPTSSGSSATAEPDPGTTAALPDTDATSGSSTGPGGVGEGEPCELYVQDCAPGLKCMPYSTDGSSWWNAVACFPVIPDPSGLGEPCEWEGGNWSGYDDCDVGQVCWTFEEGEPGVCKGVCQSDVPGNHDYDTLTCEDPLASPTGTCQECFCYCDVPCDPLAQACDEGEECVPVSDFFQCVPDASGDMGAYGDACEYVNVCDPGLTCVNAVAVPGCESGIGCCTPFCDVTQPNTCPGAAEGQECLPWYEPGEAPIGLENAGVCVLPT